MNRWRIALLFVVGCTVSVGAGYWFGFREAWRLGVAADFVPRGVIAAAQLNALRTGKKDFVVTGLEFDVDNGLIQGSELFHHPLRDLLDPVWGMRVYPEYEKYAARLADYRKKHPSLMKPDEFDVVPKGQERHQDDYRELALGVRENIDTINAMIVRYATKEPADPTTGVKK